MILQNLIQYYEQNSNSLPSFGFEYKEISFVILLDQQGNFVDIQDSRTESGEGKKMLVPGSVKRSGVGSVPNYLWDNLKYALGIGTYTNPQQKKALEEKRLSFLNNLKDKIPVLKHHTEIEAVTRFLESDFLKTLKKHTLWKEIEKLNIYISFSIERTNRLVCQEPSIMQAFTLLSKDSSEKVTKCLVTGKYEPVARLHPVIQGVYGAQGSGASLISYNSPSAESFYKEQGYNAPISQTAAFQYSTALNHLLDSSHKITFNEGLTVIFWSETNNAFENAFANFLKQTSKDLTDISGSNWLEGPEDSSSFFVQALSPNGARLSIRFSWTGLIGDLKKRIQKHVKNLELINSLTSQDTFSIYTLLQSISPCRDVKYAQDHLAGAFLLSILNDTPYPHNLLSILIERLSDEEGISHRRAALIKAYLNRSLHQPELQNSLDLSNTNIGYLLGRLFAVLEIARKQTRKKREAPGNYHFYKMASISPNQMFSYLLKRHDFHTSDLPTHLLDFFKTTIDLILAAISTFPKSLSLPSQGEFAIGYYHQKQNLFLENKKKQQSYKNEK